MYALLIFGLLILFSTEILSVFKLFSFWPLLFLWVMVLAVLVFLNMGIARSGNPFISTSFFESLSRIDWALVLILMVLIVTLGLIALTTPPNTWDAMTYHMARVAHWVQNKTVGFYPTNIQRQLYISPFAEFWIAQFFILCGGDQWANMVQWISMLGTLLGISLIAQSIGLNQSGQLLSMFFVITLPNGIVQATSTQTDFVVTLWTVIAVYFMLKNINSVKWINTLAVSMAVVLASYTKGTCFFILLPFWAWGLSVHYKVNLWRHSLLIIACLTIAQGFLLLKNYFGLGSFVFYGDRCHLLSLNDFKGIISSLLLHGFMHLRTGFLLTDQALLGFLEYLHRCLGTNIIDSSANFEKENFNLLEFPFGEDEIPNFLFYLALLAALIISFFSRRREGANIKSKYFFMSVFCFLVFNALVKWEPFDGRYHLAFFVLLAPLLADFFLGHRRLLPFIIFIFVLSAAVFVISNQSKPLMRRSNLFNISRAYKYFYNRPPSLPETENISQAIIQLDCHQVGLNIGEDTWEYPFWAFLKDKISPLRMEHVLVNNSSGDLPYPLGDFLPCVIISGSDSRTINYNGNTYMKIGSISELSLYNLIETRH